MSEATYTVAEILGQNEWAPPDDPTKRTIYWSFRAQGVDKVCEIGRKPGNDLQVGESFEATSREDRGKLKLKRVQQNFGGGKKQDAPWPRQPTPPEDAARMLRCHSQDMAIEALKLAAELGVAEKVAPGVQDVAGLVQVIQTLADRFDSDVEVAVANASMSEDDAARRSEQQW
jgi:hypothetical protein